MCTMLTDILFLMRTIFGCIGPKKHYASVFMWQSNYKSYKWKMDFKRILESVKMQKISFEQFRINLFAVLIENVCSSLSIILISWTSSSKLRRILRPGLGIQKKFKICLLFGVEYLLEAGVILCFELNSNTTSKFGFYDSCFVFSQVVNAHANMNFTLT